MRMLDAQGSHPVILTLEDGDRDLWGRWLVRLAVAMSFGFD